MKRYCTNCQAVFSPQDLEKDESKGLEAQRKAEGLQGALFRRYRCTHCGYEDIFVDIAHLDGETAEAFQERVRSLEAKVRPLQGENVGVVVQERSTLLGRYVP
jgi:hypothetical protein